MKKVKSVKINLLLCSSVLLSSLLCSYALPVSAADTAAETAAVTADEAADSSGSETAGDPAGSTVSPETDAGAAADALSKVPELILSKCYLLESDNYDSIADGYYQAVLLSEESAKHFPALTESLKALNTRITEKCTEDFRQLADNAREYIANYSTDDTAPASATLESRIIPVRQDENAVSFFTSCYSYVPGAAHGMTSYEGITIDSSTGKEVSLDQVIKGDEKALTSAISENLRYLSTGEPAEGRGEAVAEAFALEGYDPAWVLSDNGVIFRFEAYAIGNYAEGPFEAEILFSKYPDLFTEAYGPHKGAYTLPIDTVYPVTVSLSESGAPQVVSLRARPNENGDLYSYTALRVAIGDKECLRESYFFNARGYLLHTDAGKNYMYVQTTTDNDYRIISVFDLNGEIPAFVGELNGTGFTARYRRENDQSDLWYLDEQIISSPDSFCLDTHMDLMSTYSATRRYKVGEDGMPVPLTEDYEIDCDLELTSLTDLPADIVDPVTGAVTKKDAVLAKGTKCSFYRTNGVDTVDLITSDGTVYRFLVTEKWPQKVNGLRLDQAFEGTMFAG